MEASAPTVPLGAGRGAVVTAPPGRRLLVARLLGADGYPLADVGLAPVVLGQHTVARGRGWAATATRIEVAAAIPGAVVPVETTCVQVTRGLSPDCLDDAPGTIHVAATCSPRVVHVFGPGRAATLELADGRRRAATARHGGWHALLRAHEALRAVRIAGKRVRLAVQPPAAQCGYHGTVVG